MGSRNLGLLLFMLLFPTLMFTIAEAEEDKLIIRGKVLEKGTGKPLEGLVVYLVGHETESTTSGQDGSYNLTVNDSGNYSVSATGTGYGKPNPVEIAVGPQMKTTDVTLYLEPVYSMMEVVIQEDRNKDKTAKTVITGKELVSVPGSFGDPLRGMQALPGVTTSSDEGSNPAIRGSGPNDNAYYVDFLPVGYLFHMGGMQSVFNADLVDNFNIYSSAFGPEFANVTGGVIDVQLRKPRTDRLGGKFNVSMLESDLLLEGPLSTDQSFYIAARRSYIDLFMSDFQEDGVEFRQFPRFYDYQGKYIWNISPDHTLNLQASGAKDEMVLNLTNESEAVIHDPILAGNFSTIQEYHQQGVTLSSRISPRVSNRLGISYLTRTDRQQFTQLGHMAMAEHTYLLRNHVNLAAGNNHEVLVGVDYAYGKVKLDIDAPKTMGSDFTPPPDYTSSDRYTNNDSLHYYSLDLALKDRWKLRDNMTVILGGHATYEDYFDRYRFEPRLSAEYYLSRDVLLTAGWGKYHQLAQGHEIISNGGNPTLGYLEADHYVAGIEQQVKDGWSVRLEGYYKDLENLPVPHQPENYVNGGSGKAYGSELLIKKRRTTDWTGWLAVGYSKTERRNDLTGESFPFAYDQPLIINLVYEWNFTSKWTFGAKWRYQSGAPVTPVIGTYTDGTGRLRPVYGELGSERLPAYHRLDLRFKRDYLFNTWKMGAYLDIINAYSRENVSGYEYNADYTSRKKIAQMPFMPSIGIQVEF
jgi:hypothetical protein